MKPTFFFRFAATSALALFQMVLFGQNQWYYGVTSGGGAEGYGTIFRINPEITTIEQVYEFSDYAEGISPLGSLCQAPNGFLYGTTYTGGINNFGGIYKFNPVTFEKETIHLFTGGDGSFSEADITLASNGKLYGTALGGNEGGVLFEIDPTTDEFLVVHEFPLFDGSDNCVCENGLELFESELYGFCSNGGSESWGYLFKYNPDNQEFSVLHEFDGVTLGGSPEAKPLFAGDGWLYGTTTQFGIQVELGTIPSGVLFRMDVDSFAGTPLNYFYSGSLLGSGPYVHQLVEGEPGTIYGTTRNAGLQGEGTLFRYDTDSLGTDSLPADDVEALVHFSEDIGYFASSLTALPDGRLVGYCAYNSSNTGGSIFTYNPEEENTGQAYQVVFESVDGNPLSGLINTQLTLVDLSLLNTSTSEEETFKIYPNPASGFIHLPATADVVVTDAMGRVVFSGAGHNGRLSLAGWPAGMYFVRSALNINLQGAVKLIKY